MPLPTPAKPPSSTVASNLPLPIHGVKCTSKLSSLPRLIFPTTVPLSPCLMRATVQHVLARREPNLEAKARISYQ
jgi:hypothetical protein